MSGHEPVQKPDRHQRLGRPYQHVHRIKHLTERFAYTRQAVLGLDQSKITGTQKLFVGDRTIIESSFIMSGDLHEHLAQLIAYARMHGIKPPWSK